MKSKKQKTEIEKYGQPLKFYVLATLIPWAFWFAAAYVSHLTPTRPLYGILIGAFGVLGLIGSATVAFWMIWPYADLRADLKSRLIGLKGVKPIYLLLTFLLMPASILLGQTISLLFGHSVNQFSFSDMSSFSAGIFPGWFLLFLAPLIEELAWHSYGTDTLRVRMNLLKTSLLFGIF